MDSNFTLRVDGMTCGHCVSAVRQALSNVPGVASSDVAIGTAAVTVQQGYDSVAVRSAAEQAVSEAGYGIAADREHPVARNSGCGCGMRTVGIERR